MKRHIAKKSTLTQTIYATLNRALTGPKNDDPRRVGTSEERLEYLTDTLVSALVPFVISGEIAEDPRPSPKTRVPGHVVAEVQRQRIVLGKSVIFDTCGPWRDDPMTILSVEKIDDVWSYRVSRNDPDFPRPIIDWRWMFAPLHNGRPTKLTYRIEP